VGLAGLNVESYTVDRGRDAQESQRAEGEREQHAEGANDVPEGEGIRGAGKTGENAHRRLTDTEMLLARGMLRGSCMASKARVRAQAEVGVGREEQAKVRVRPPPEARSKGVSFACPITKEPLLGSTFASPTLGVTYPERFAWVDFSLQRPTGGRIGGVFETSQVSTLYEDYGWRDSFARAGFPGPDAELETALSFMGSSACGIVVDMSCATGIFTRRLANTRLFDAILAMDISETMLAQCASRIERRTATSVAHNILLARADVAQLPLETASVDAVHAGAAIHCWPNAELAVAEVARVLKPGGVFVGSTFLDPVSGFVGGLVGDDVVGSIARRLRDQRANFVNVGNDGVVRQWTEQELRATIEQAGLIWNSNRDRRRQYIMYSGSKPEISQ
jgi:ubiquinone/menaquinone biosynthesis C-methylase UbiE